MGLGQGGGWQVTAVNRLVIESAEAMAVELAGRDEKWAAQAICGLLLLVDRMDAELQARRKAETSELLERIADGRRPNRPDHEPGWAI